MIARGMNRKGMPLFPVTRYDAAWPPATAVSGADAATVKNTRSRVPSARRCSCPVTTGAPGSPVGRLSVVAIFLSSSSGVREPAAACRVPTPIQGEVRQDTGALDHRRQRHPLVD